MKYDLLDMSVHKL